MRWLIFYNGMCFPRHCTDAHAKSCCIPALGRLRPNSADGAGCRNKQENDIHS